MVVIAISILLFWTLQLAGAWTTKGYYGPAYERELSPALGEPATGDSGLDTSSGVEVPSEGGRNAVVNSVTGRVLFADRSTVPGCRIVLRPRSAEAAATEFTAIPDREGYFEVDVPQEHYSVVAYAPGACMFPVKPRSAVPGGPPVRIYMHVALRARIQLIDAGSGNVLLPPANSILTAKVGDYVLPANTRAETFPEMLGPYDHRETILSKSHLVVRVLGTKPRELLGSTPFITVMIQAPGLEIGLVNIPFDALSAVDAVYETPATIRSGYVPVWLQATYGDGSPIQHSVFLTFHRPRREIPFGGVNLSEPTLVCLPPGEWRASIGAIAPMMREVKVDVPDGNYGASVISMPRGADVEVVVIRDEETRPFRNAAVTEAFGDGRTGLKIDTGNQWRRDPYRFLDLVPGDYVVSAIDANGTEHSRVLTLQRGSMTRVVFQEGGT